MNKKQRNLLIIGPLLIINIFNISFILYKLKGTHFLKEATHILCNYFIGFHLLLLILVLTVLLLWKFMKKISLSLYLYRLSVVIFLFLIAINLSLFPEINEDFGQGKYDFRWKRDSSLKEAIRQSPAKIIRTLKSYLQMNQYLKGKILTVPSSSILEKDHFFKVFIEPEEIREQDYDSLLSDGNYERLKDFKSVVFHHLGEETGIQNYRIIIGIPSDEYRFYVYKGTILFIPSDLRDIQL